MDILLIVGTFYGFSFAVLAILIWRAPLLAADGTSLSADDRRTDPRDFHFKTSPKLHEALSP